MRNMIKIPLENHDIKEFMVFLNFGSFQNISQKLPCDFEIVWKVTPILNYLKHL
jgi:hypothetical protein